MYAWVLLAADPAVVIAMEYVPVLVALVILGSGRPSADDMLLAVASTPGSYYGRIDPVHHLKSFFDAPTAPLRRYVPTILRVGMGITFVYLGLIEKLADPGRALSSRSTISRRSSPSTRAVGRRRRCDRNSGGLALIAGFFTRGAPRALVRAVHGDVVRAPGRPRPRPRRAVRNGVGRLHARVRPLSFDRLVGRPALDDDDGAVIAAD